MMIPKIERSVILGLLLSLLTGCGAASSPATESQAAAPSTQTIPNAPKTVAMMTATPTSYTDFETLSPGPESSHSLATEEPTTIVHASWAVGYTDLSQLKKDADIAVSGSFIKIEAVVQDTAGNPFTDYIFSIQRVIYDPGKRLAAKTDSVIIRQTGAIQPGTAASDKPTVFQIDDDPLFQIGEKAVLFLHEWEPGHYFVIGGPSGRFTVTEAGISPVAKKGVPDVAGLAEAAFIEKIQAAP